MEEKLYLGKLGAQRMVDIIKDMADNIEEKFEPRAFYIHFELGEESKPGGFASVTADKTYAELTSALNEGKQIYGVVEDYAVPIVGSNAFIFSNLLFTGELGWVLIFIDEAGATGSRVHDCVTINVAANEDGVFSSDVPFDALKSMLEAGCKSRCALHLSGLKCWLNLEGYTSSSIVYSFIADGISTTVVVPSTGDVVVLHDELVNRDALEELSADVAYINSEDNESIEEAKEPVFDVTAEVGQTIIVKEVDANGKPTKWESADYQPRTHGIEIGELLPITAATFSEGDGAFVVPNVDFQFEVGRQYTINWNGTPYTCIAFDESDGFVGIGNAALLLGTGDTGEPFFAATVGGILMAIPLDGSTELNIGVSGEVVKKIDKLYLPKDTLYGEPIYAKPVFLLEDWYYAQTDFSDLLVSTGETGPWVNTTLTKKHWEKLVEIFETHLLLLEGRTIEIAEAYNTPEYYQIERYSLIFVSAAIKGNYTRLRLRWSDTDNCVQRSCYVDTVG